MQWMLATGAIVIGVGLLAWATGRVDQMSTSYRPRQRTDPRRPLWRGLKPRVPEPEDYLPPEAAAEVRRNRRGD